MKGSIIMKKILIRDVYSLKKLWDNIPYGAENLYHITIDKYGYVHDTGIEVILTPIVNGEEPKGWDTLEKDLIRITKDIYSMWIINDKFGYH
jgi:hypothetical protein